MVGLSAALANSLSGLRLGGVRHRATAHNTANLATDGYKSVDILASSVKPGGVAAASRTLVDQQGPLIPTAVPTDLAISGAGFLPVEDKNGHLAFTRAGSFRLDSQGRLKNAAGEFLLGYPITNGKTDQAVDIRPVLISLPSHASGGPLQAVTMTSDGILRPIYADSQETGLFRIPVALFPAPYALKDKSGPSFEDHVLAGSVSFHIPGSHGAGRIESGFLEQSSSSIERQAMDTVLTRQLFAANVQAVRVADKMTRGLLNVKV